MHNIDIGYTQIHISHKITTLKSIKTKKNKPAHKGTQAVKGILPPMDTA
jgi:hypothetical protein